MNLKEICKEFKAVLRFFGDILPKLSEQEQSKILECGEELAINKKKAKNKTAKTHVHKLDKGG